MDTGICPSPGAIFTTSDVVMEGPYNHWHTRKIRIVHLLPSLTGTYFLITISSISHQMVHSVKSATATNGDHFPH